MRTYLRVRLGAVILCLVQAACGGGTEGNDDRPLSRLDVILGEQSTRVEEVASLGLLAESASVRVTDGVITVFIGIPRSAATVGTASIGTQAGETVTLWASDGSTNSPWLATSGSLDITEIDLSPGGQLRAQVVGAVRSADDYGPGLRVDGTVVGNWPAE